VIDRETGVPEALLERVGNPGRSPIAENLVELGTQLLAILRRTVAFAELARSSPDSDLVARAFARSRATPQGLVQMCTRYFQAERALGRLPAVPPDTLGRVFFAAILERVLSETALANPVFVAESDTVFLRELVQVVLHGALAAGTGLADPR
jgi:hypothetical protein